MKKILTVIGLILCMLIAGCQGNGNDRNESPEPITPPVTELGTDTECAGNTQETAPAEPLENTSTTEITETTIPIGPETTTEPHEQTEATAPAESTTDHTTEPSTESATESTDETFLATLPPEWGFIETERDES